MTPQYQGFPFGYKKELYNSSRYISARETLYCPNVLRKIWSGDIDTAWTSNYVGYCCLTNDSRYAIAALKGTLSAATKLMMCDIYYTSSSWTGHIASGGSFLGGNALYADGHIKWVPPFYWTQAGCSGLLLPVVY